MGVSDIIFVYSESIISELVRATYGCGIIWSKLDNDQYQTESVRNNPQQLWEFYLKRSDLFYSLNVIVNKKQILSINSNEVNNLEELFSVVENKVNDSLNKPRKLSSLLNALPGCTHAYDIIGGGGIIVGGSAGSLHPTGTGIYVFSQSSTTSSYNFLKYNKSLIDSLGADPNSNAANSLWTIATTKNYNIYDMKISSDTGFIYSVGTSAVIYDSTPNPILTLNTNASNNAIDVDTKGNFVIVGIANLGNDYTCIWKYNINGELLFSQKWGTDAHAGGDYASCTGVCIDGNDNIYLTGGDTNSSLNYNNIVNVKKLDSNGKLIWSTIVPDKYGHGQAKHGYGQGVAGITSDDRATIKLYNGHLYVGSSQGWLSKLDLDGNLVWNLHLTKPAIKEPTYYTSEFTGIISCFYIINDLIYICGSYSVLVTYTDGTGSGWPYSPGQQEQVYLLLQCYDTDKNLIWEQPLTQIVSGRTNPDNSLNIGFPLSLTSDGIDLYVSYENSPLVVYDALTGNQSFKMLDNNDWHNGLFQPITLATKLPYSSTPSNIGGVIIGGSAVIGTGKEGYLVGQGGVKVAGTAIDNFVSSGGALKLGYYLTVQDTDYKNYIIKLDKSLLDSSKTLSSLWHIAGISSLNGFFTQADENIYVRQDNGNVIEVMPYTIDGNQLFNDRFVTRIAPIELRFDKENKILVAGTPYDIYNYDFVKLDLSGNILADLGQTTTLNSVCVDGDNNIYLTGRQIPPSGIGFNDLVKYSPSGVFQWGWQQGVTVFKAIVHNNYLYMVGLLESPSATAGLPRATTRKFDLNGNLLWSVGLDYGAYDIAVDSKGFIYTAGYDDSSGSNTVGFIKKYDSDGNFIWKSRGTIPPFGTDSNHNYLNKIIIDRNDHIYSFDPATGKYLVFCDVDTGELSLLDLTSFLTSYPIPHLLQIVDINLDALGLDNPGGVLVGGSAVLT